MTLALVLWLIFKTVALVIVALFCLALAVGGFVGAIMLSHAGMRRASALLFWATMVPGPIIFLACLVLAACALLT